MKLNLGILSLFLALGSTTQMRAEETEMKVLMDFKKVSPEVKWVAVNDGVMGGVSQGGSEIKDGVMIFSGTLSLENNGGFSSVRTQGETYDFTGKSAMVLRVKGDGRTYQLRLATDARYNGSAISYGAEFKTTKGKWVEVRVPLESLSPSWRGRELDGPAFDKAKIEELGILLGDKTPGSFSLEVNWLGVE